MILYIKELPHIIPQHILQPRARSVYAAFNGAYGDIKSRGYFVLFIAVGV